MILLLRLTASVCVLLLSLAAIAHGVRFPALENGTLQRVTMIDPASRTLHGLLAEAETFDPYLRGRALLQRARFWRATGRSARAVADYRESLRGRVDPETRIELGLYLLELGRLDESMEELVRAVRYSDEYLRTIPGKELRARVNVLALEAG